MSTPERSPSASSALGRDQALDIEWSGPDRHDRERSRGPAHEIRIEVVEGHRVDRREHLVEGPGSPEAVDIGPKPARPARALTRPP